MDDYITIIFNENEEKTTCIARNKLKDSVITNLPIDSTLDMLGLERVPINEFVPKQLIKKDDKILNEQCSICHEKYIRGEYKRTLKCGHVYHRKCIDVWLKTNVTCPCCRTEIIKME